MPRREEWRPIPGWVGLYEVSNAGQVRSVTAYRKGRYGPTRYKGRILKPGKTTGYATVSLVETGHGRRYFGYVHDLVLLAFIGEKPPGLEVCHGPGGALDNHLSNLRYDTRSANAMDRHLFGKGWAPGKKKPPVQCWCAVCKKEMFVKRRKDGQNHICGRECLRVWGRMCVLRGPK